MQIWGSVQSALWARSALGRQGHISSVAEKDLGASAVLGPMLSGPGEIGPPVTR